MLKKLLYGNNYIYLRALDSILKAFPKTGYMENGPFYSGTHKLKEFPKLMERLEQDGYIKRTPRVVEITTKGELFINSGGFLRQQFIKRLAAIGVAIGTLAGLVALLDYFFR